MCRWIDLIPWRSTPHPLPRIQLSNTKHKIKSRRTVRTYRGRGEEERQGGSQFHGWWSGESELKRSKNKTDIVRRLFDEVLETGDVSAKRNLDLCDGFEWMKNEDVEQEWCNAHYTFGKLLHLPLLCSPYCSVHNRNNWEDYIASSARDRNK